VASEELGFGIAVATFQRGKFFLVEDHFAFTSF
jgi:hypothetical protein